MDEQTQRKDDVETESERRTANLILLVGAVLIIGIAIWLVNAMLDARDADNCISSGRRNCGRIEAPAR